MIFRGDSTIQHTVHKTGNGGHGGLLLVWDIGHKLLTLIFALLETGSHIIKCQRQILHFIGSFRVYLHAGIQIAVTKVMGHFCHIPQRLTLPAGKQRHDTHRQQNDHDRHE